LQRAFNLALLVLPAAIWASLVVVGVNVMVDVGPVTLSWITWLLGTVVLLILSATGLRRDWRIVRAELPTLAFCALTGIALFQALWYAGLLAANPASVAILTATLPVMIAVVAAVTLGERLNRTQLVGVLVTLASALWIGVSGNLQQLARVRIGHGEIMILLANVSMAAYTVALKRWPTRLEATPFMAAVATLGAAMLLPAAWLEGGFASGAAPFIEHVAAIAYVGVFASALAYVMWNQSVARNGASITGLVLYTQPAFALLFCRVFLNQPVLPYHWAGLALLALGVVLVSRTGAAAAGATGTLADRA
jgi:drug/metabolite transporter (DMT)-like permease